MCSYSVLHGNGQCSRRLAHASIHDVKLHGIRTLRYVVSSRFHFNYINTINDNVNSFKRYASLKYMEMDSLWDLQSYTFRSTQCFTN